MFKAWPYMKLCMALLLYQTPRNLKTMTVNFTEKCPDFLCNPHDELWSYPVHPRNNPMISNPWQSFDDITSEPTQSAYLAFIKTLWMCLPAFLGSLLLPLCLKLHENDLLINSNSASYWPKLKFFPVTKVTNSSFLKRTLQTAVDQVPAGPSLAHIPLPGTFWPYWLTTAKSAVRKEWYQLWLLPTEQVSSREARSPCLPVLSTLTYLLWS